VTAAPPGRLADAGTEAEALIQEARRRQHRRWLAAGVAMAVVAAATATVIAGSGAGSRLRFPGSQGLPAHRHGLPAAAAARAATLVTVSQTRLPKGNWLSLAVRYGAVWVTGIGVTYQINAVTGEIVRTIPTPGGLPGYPSCPSSVAAGAGAVWVTHSCRGIYRIDPHSGRVTASLRISAADGTAVADGLIWVIGDHGMVRIQPRTDRIVGKPIRVADGVIVPGAGALWVTCYGCGYPSTVYRVDPVTGAVKQFANSAVIDVQAVGAGSLWSSQVQRVDPTGKVIATFFVLGPSQVVFWKGSAWALTLRRSLTFLRIDPATNQVTGTPVPVGKPVPAAWGTEPTAIAAGPTGLWVLDGRNLLYHLAMRPARP
jgi:DNA-binding beta-propeller fold protein YncE